MNTKSLLFLTALFGVSGMLHGTPQDTVTVSTQIHKAVVYYQGAQLTRKGEISLPEGTHTLRLEGLPYDLVPASVQVLPFQGLSVKSVETTHLQVTKERKSERERMLEDSVQAQEYVLHGLYRQSIVFQKEQDLLFRNQELRGGSEGVPVNTIREAAAFYNKRLNEIERGMLDLQRKKDHEEEVLRDLLHRIQEVTSERQKPSSVILVRVQCERALQGTLRLKYYLPSAGWTPGYDFRMQSTAEPLTLGYKARVFQSTGEDWDEVRLTLTSSDPQFDFSIPQYKTWYIERGLPESKQVVENEPGAIEGIVRDAETGEPLPFVNVTLMQGEEMINGTATDFDGRFVFNPVPAGNHKLQASFIGYRSIRDEITVQAGSAGRLVILMESSLQLSEVAMTTAPSPREKNKTVTSKEIARMPARGVAGLAATTGGVYMADGGSFDVHGSRSDANFVFIDGIKVRGSNNLPQSATSTRYGYTRSSRSSSVAKSTGLSTKALADTKEDTRTFEYVLQEPYTIPSDGKKYHVDIKQVTVPARYLFVVHPRVNPKPTLTAEITGWEGLNLTAGTASVYHEGVYVGETQLETGHLNDTLRLSLGPTEKILVSRTLVRTKSNRIPLGNQVRQTIAWEVQVKNTTSETIDLEVIEQIPVALNKENQVRLTNTSNARLNENNGKLTWNLRLSELESRTLEYSYETRLPKR